MFIALAIYYVFAVEAPSGLPGSLLDKDEIPSLFFDSKTKAIHCNTHDISIYTTFGLIFLLFFLNYLVIVRYLRKYKKYIAEYSGIMSERTLEINKCFMIILFLQSIVPIISCGIPVIIFLFLIIVTKSESLGVLGTLTINILMISPTINSILFLALVPRNRKIICGLVSKCLSNFKQCPKISGM
uniref:G_PROTEIN_RECEP_F1_2 domain-containing protein n=1 Tax=Parastrongyloides trichosuri TaxID=131310 RepID=A0A0N4ZD34_PARTI